MQTYSGVFNGTGAAIYLCLGFVPDFVKIIALENATNDEGAYVEWRRNNRGAEANEGFFDSDGNTDRAALAFGAGVAPFRGGTIMTAALQTSVTYGEGVYLVPTRSDRRLISTSPRGGDGSGADIDKWTLTTPGSRTGKFNADIVASGNQIQEGSMINIDGNVYRIEAITAGQGSADDEVTLDVAVGSSPGQINHIGPSFDLQPLALGKVAPKGILLSATSGVNVNDELNLVVAERYDITH